ncbi:glucans biosynthesis glucosyltransferase MdoH [bacterium]|nr:glucans biosynthesis glucosyltransferase MdoH [bacterium]
MPADGPEGPAFLTRSLALAFSLCAGFGAFALFLNYGAGDGLDATDWIRSLLICISTFWLAWGAAQALAGLTTRPPLPPRDTGPITARTVVLVPVYNEDPLATFARVAVMDAALQSQGLANPFHFAILSDTRDDQIAQREDHWFLRLLDKTRGDGRIFYRRRAANRGRKAGNISDFITASGAAYDFAIILDADSLMEADTMVEMVRRMQAVPDLGLLQTLPKVINAQSRFGRMMQFSAAFYSPIFCRGLAMMQGRTGPFWGHNAIVRVRAFAASCGLPELSGDPPFGGHILSHDYVEAALLARAGWIVRVDDDLEGSYEEGPGNMVDHAKRDRRWCQGNLQHARLLLAPGLKMWSRFVFLQGILAYLSSLVWLAFLGASIAAPLFSPPVDYFPIEGWPFPVLPPSEALKAIALGLGIVGLLFIPKFLILADAAGRGRAPGFGGVARATASVVGELLFTSIASPVFLMYQTRSILQVMLGSDGGWPAQSRGDGRMEFATAWAASSWIVITGALGLILTHLLAPNLLLWILPVAGPMMLAPAIIAWSSGPARPSSFATPLTLAPSGLMLEHRRLLSAWLGEGPDAPHKAVVRVVSSRAG